MMAIKVNNLSKKFKLYSSSGKRVLEYLTMGRIKGHTDFWALQDISFDVPKGTTVGIIGQNGSGKSTLLSILAGVLPPSRGSYQVNGKISAILELGSGFHPEFTGRDNVYMYGSIMGLSKQEIDDKFDEILHFSELGDFIDQPLRTYSSGMIVRLAFSVAVNVNCDIMIVDEALAVGDAIFQHRCFRKIRDMQEEGKTILYVGHDTEAVRSLCNYAILLDGGRIIDMGQPSSVVNKYQAMIIEREKKYYRSQTLSIENIFDERKFEINYDFIKDFLKSDKKVGQPGSIDELIKIIDLPTNPPKKAIFAHPISSITYHLPKIEQSSILGFGIALHPEIWDKDVTGAIFKIFVNKDGKEEKIFEEILKSKTENSDRKIGIYKIDLNNYVGNDIQLKFITEGETEDLRWCWACWIEPRIAFKFSKIAPESGGSQNIPEVRYGDRRAEVVKVEIFDENEIPTNIFKSGDLSIFRMHIQFNEDFEKNLSCGYILSNKHIDIYSINTKWYGIDLGKIRKGETRFIDFKQQLNLGSGIYSLTNCVSIRNSENNIEILDCKVDTSFIRIESIKKFSGCVDLKSMIEVHK